MVAVLAGCSGVSPQDAGLDPVDASVGPVDAGVMQDAGIDAGPADAGSETDGGAEADAGLDAGPGDPCAVNNGGCDVLTLCTVVNEQATCGACPAGFSGDGASGCIDVDECATVPDAGCGGTTFCANTPGAFRCLERPTGIVLFDPQDTQGQGNLSGTPHLQPCPPGQVSVGYDLGSNNQSKITTASAVCAALTLSGSPTAGYTLTTPPSTGDRMCPANEVVTGMALAFNTDLQSLTVSCAPLSVQLDPNSGFTVVTGTPHSLPRYPTASSPAPNLAVACPPNTVGAGEVTNGGQWLFGFAMRCVRPAMKFDVPAISFGATTDAAFVGITAGSTPDSRDLCPAGQIVTGLELQSQWRSFAVECGTPVFDLPLRVAVTPADPLAYHGLLAPQFAHRCPWDAAVTHVELVTFNSSTLGIGLHCATFTGSIVPPVWSVSVDATAVAVPLPPFASPPKTTTCAAGEVAVGVQSSLTTQSNGYRTLSHLGLVCAAPQVP